MLKNNRFFSRILLPSLVALLLFMASVYLFVIPNYRESLMSGKRETIRELTNTSWSVMHKLHLVVNDTFTLQQAQREAILIISDMRYGDELKDYFWITDTLPRMVMHPYRPTLNGQDLTNYRDARGKNFFVEIVNLVKENGDGYVNYKWQWKDDSLTVVPKLSYVKVFEPWGWIVGTGIYIEDVNRQISNLTQKVVWISVLLTVLIGFVIAYLAQRNYVAELERTQAQEKLHDSMERYKKLVEATTDGVCMVLDGEIVFCNPILINMLGYNQNDFEVKSQHLFGSLSILVKSIEKAIDTNDKKLSSTTELRIIGKEGNPIDMLANRSSFEMNGRKGSIFTVNDVSNYKSKLGDTENNFESIKLIANTLNFGMFRCTVGRNARFIEFNAMCLRMLGYSSEIQLQLVRVQDLFEKADERKGVFREINNGKTIKQRLLRLRRFDGSVMNAVVSLLPFTDTDKNVVYCDGYIAEAHIHFENIWTKASNVIGTSAASKFLEPVMKIQKLAPVCAYDATVKVASVIMKNEDSNFVVVLNHALEPFGILTHSDITKREIANSGNVSGPISALMSAPIISVKPEDIVLDAFELMIKHKISQVIVNNSNFKPGYICLQSILEQTAFVEEFTLNSISKAQYVYELKTIVDKLPFITEQLVENGSGASTIGKLISRVSDKITQKLIELAIEKIGQPPVEFVFLVLGSEGRKEQTLATDQDNAIVYDSNPNNQYECKKYFLNLGKEVCSNLDKIGLPFCKGGVMCMNEQWCMGLDEWNNTITQWTLVPNPQEILNISIFFDFQPLYGNFELAEKIQAHCSKSLRENNVFLFNLAKSIIGLKNPSIDSLSSSESLDLKMQALIITSIVRLWCLKFEILHRNTAERMKILAEYGILPFGLIADFDQAFNFLFLLRIKTQIMQSKSNEFMTNDVKAHNLSEAEKLKLKRISGMVSDHLTRLSMEFKMV